MMLYNLYFHTLLIMACGVKRFRMHPLKPSSLVENKPQTPSSSHAVWHVKFEENEPDAARLPSSTTQEYDPVVLRRPGSSRRGQKFGKSRFAVDERIFRTADDKRNFFHDELSGAAGTDYTNDLQLSGRPLPAPLISRFPGSGNKARPPKLKRRVHSAEFVTDGNSWTYADPKNAKGKRPPIPLPRDPANINRSSKQLPANIPGKLPNLEFRTKLDALFKKDLKENLSSATLKLKSTKKPKPLLNRGVKDRTPEASDNIIKLHRSLSIGSLYTPANVDTTYGKLFLKAFNDVAKEGVKGLKRLSTLSVKGSEIHEAKIYWKIEAGAIGALVGRRFSSIISVAPIRDQPNRFTFGTKEKTGRGTIRGPQIVVSGDKNNLLIQALKKTSTSLAGYCSTTKDPDCVSKSLGNLRFDLTKDELMVSVPSAFRHRYQIAHGIPMLNAVLQNSRSFGEGKWKVRLNTLPNLGSPHPLVIDFNIINDNKPETVSVICDLCGKLESYYYTVVNAINIIASQGKEITLDYKPLTSKELQEKHLTGLSLLKDNVKKLFQPNQAEDSKKKQTLASSPASNEDLTLFKKEVFEAWLLAELKKKAVTLAMRYIVAKPEKFFYAEFISPSKGRMYFAENLMMNPTYTIVQFTVKNPLSVPGIFRKSPTVYNTQSLFSLGSTNIQGILTHDSQKVADVVVKS